MADEKIYTNIGHATAYAYAKSKGYTGTEEQFATDQANFAANAQQVREDKESVEATVATFGNTTVPAAVQTVTAEGTRQVGIVGTAGDTQVSRVQAEGTTQVGVVQTEGTTQKNAVQAKGDEVIASIPSDYTELTEEVEDLKSAFTDINTPGGKTSVTTTWTDGKYISEATNTIVNGGPSLSVSEYIKIPIGIYDIYITNIERFSNNGWTIAFYNVNKEFISGIEKLSAYSANPDFDVTTIPDNAAYFVLGHVNSGNKPTSNITITISTFERIGNIENDISDVQTGLSFDNTYRNILAGANSFEDNKIVNDQGYVTGNPNFCLISGYFPVKPNTQYKIHLEQPRMYSNAGHNWTFYDKNKAYISGSYVLSAQPVTSPANAAYLRFAVYISSTGSVTHETFDPSKVVITEGGKPEFNDTFITTVSRPTYNKLKWIGIGDSITEENFRATYHYWDYIIAETGLNFVNMGVSGTGYKSEGSGDKAFYKRVPNMATDADVVTIFGGVNDVVLSNADIGTETDTGTTTICGCVNTTIDAIETLYPAHMPIGIISPLPCYCSDTTVNIHPYQQPNDDTCRMAQFVAQLALICKHRGIPFLDLFHQSNLRPWHSECNAKYFSCNDAPTGDGLHPNEYGHRLFYRQIMDFVKKIVMK